MRPPSFILLWMPPFSIFSQGTDFAMSKISKALNFMDIAILCLQKYFFNPSPQENLKKFPFSTSLYIRFQKFRYSQNWKWPQKWKQPQNRKKCHKRERQPKNEDNPKKRDKLKNEGTPKLWQDLASKPFLNLFLNAIEKNL